MGDFFVGPNIIPQGSLPLRPEHLPPSNMRENTDAVATLGREILCNLDRDSSCLTSNDFFKALMPSYDNACESLRVLTNEIHEQNKAVSTLRELKQLIRKLQQEEGRIDLDKEANLQNLLKKCKKDYGLIIPEKQKLNKEDIDAIMHNIEDVSSNYSDIGDEKRLHFKKLNSDQDATLRLLVSVMNVWEAMVKLIISHFRNN
ncbi:MAG: hypothetical protein NTY13_02080 [Chlamydiae bacterium]|nr:hypothetical protein [Chlamydiota bacterium]